MARSVIAHYHAFQSQYVCLVFGFQQIPQHIQIIQGIHHITFPQFRYRTFQPVACCRVGGNCNGLQSKTVGLAISAFFGSH